MTRLASIVMFLFCIGAAAQGLNSVNLFGTAVPDQQLTIGGAVVTDLQSGAEAASTGQNGLWDVIVLFTKVIGSGVLAVFTVVPMILGWGTAIGLDALALGAVCTFIQVPLWIVMIYDLFTMWTGRTA